jgi:O-antigen ligase
MNTTSGTHARTPAYTPHLGKPLTFSLVALAVLLLAAQGTNPLFLAGAIVPLIPLVWLAYRTGRHNAILLIYLLFIASNIFLRLFLDSRNITDYLPLDLLGIAGYFFILLFWLFRRRLRPEGSGPAFRFDGYTWTLILYFGWSLLATLVGIIEFHRIAIGLVTIVPALLGGYFLLRASLRDENDVIAVLFVLTLSGAIISLLSFHQFYFGEGFVHATRYLNRMTGYFINANTLGVTQFVCGTAALILLIATPSRYMRPVYLVVLVSITASLFLSFSRTSILSLLLSSAFVLWYTMRRLFYLLAVTVSAISAGFAILYWETISFFLRVEQAFSLRDYIWASSWEIFKKNPLIGLGVGNSSRAVQPYLPYFFMGERKQTHNTYLEVMIDTGIVGLGLYLAIFVVFFRHTLHTIRNFEDSRQRSLLVGLVGLTFGSMVHKMFEAYGSFGKVGFMVPLLFIVMTMGIWLSERIRSTSRERSGNHAQSA